VAAVVGRVRRLLEKEEGGGVYGPWVAGPWERVVTGMVVVMVAAQAKQCQQDGIRVELGTYMRVMV